MERRNRNGNKKDPKSMLELLERIYIKIATSVFFTVGYFILSKYFLNWISMRYFPEANIRFQWNVLNFVENNQE